jgi:hypothetical protein
VFTSANYAAPQVVTVKGVNDDVQDGAQPYKILTAPAVSNDPNYASIDASNVDVKNTDNDSAGITIGAASQIMTSESAGSATFTVVLNSQPAPEATSPSPSSAAIPKEGTPPRQPQVHARQLACAADRHRQGRG